MKIERDTARLADLYDVVVVGGGITGVSVAREAAGRGLRTVLIDKGDFGQGTSSATSKYLHGGIRYLETYEFGVVRESLRERRVLALAAPHLVSQQRFVMPAWSWSKPPTLLIGAGVGLYTLLGFDRNRNMPDAMKIPMPRWIPKRRLIRDVPWLDQDQLQGAYAYHDTFNLHPERLLLAFVKSAAASGAQVFNHVEATGFIVDEPASGNGTDIRATWNTGAAGDRVRVRGVYATDRITGEYHEIRARAVVNAAGPWMDIVLEKLGRPMGVRVQRSKGVHLLTRPIGGVGPDGPTVSDTVFARARSGNHVIVSPWQGKSFIGPTDTPIDSDPDSVRVDGADVELILATVNDTIAAGHPKLTVDDIEATTVGIRPLIVDESKDSYTTSRRHELYDHAPGGVLNLWSIGGGKWTTGRALGDETLSSLLKSPTFAGVRTRPYDSRRTAAFGAFGWAQDPQPFFDEAKSHAKLLDAETMMHLARLYGTERESIVDLVRAEPKLAQRLSDLPGRHDIAAQAVYAVSHEGARTLADVVDRRLVLGTLGAVQRNEIERVAVAVAELFGWSSENAAAHVDAELARRANLIMRWRHIADPLPSGDGPR